MVCVPLFVWLLHGVCVCACEQVMCMAVGTFPPSHEFEDYLLNFILLHTYVVSKSPPAPPHTHTSRPLPPPSHSHTST